MAVEFEDITNRVGKLIQNTTAIQDYAVANLGGNLNVEDNAIIKAEYQPSFPFCVISKEDEKIFKNEEAVAQRKSNIWYTTIVFVADFGMLQTNTIDFDLPASARKVINGITTNMPSDYMRILARKIAELLTEGIACGEDTQGVMMSNYNIVVDDYYENNDGKVAAVLNFELYKRNNFTD